MMVGGWLRGIANFSSLGRAKGGWHRRLRCDWGRLRCDWDWLVGLRALSSEVGGSSNRLGNAFNFVVR